MKRFNVTPVRQIGLIWTYQYPHVVAFDAVPIYMNAKTRLILNLAWSRFGFPICLGEIP